MTKCLFQASNLINSNKISWFLTFQSSIFYSSRHQTTCAIKEGNNIIFYINLGGFPLANDVMTQMWDYAKELQPDGNQWIFWIVKESFLKLI